MPCLIKKREQKKRKTSNLLAIILGGGDVASGVAYNLYNSGIKVVILERKNPLAVRRTVSFAQSVIDKKTVVEGVTAILADNSEDAVKILRSGNIPVLIESLSDAIAVFNPDVVIDATIAKKNQGLKKDMARLTIALGPGFIAGIDADIVIETNRGEKLGEIIKNGSSSLDTGIPASVMGYSKERVLRAPADGIVEHIINIGDFVKKGAIICYVNKNSVKAPFDGIVRGLIANGSDVVSGLKIGDVDPRCDKKYCYSISDKAHAIGKAAVTAIKNEFF